MYRTPGTHRDFDLPALLRRIYADPLTGKADWAVVPAAAGGIIGVRSHSPAAAVRTAAQAANGGGWRFIYEPPISPADPTAAGAAMRRQRGRTRVEGFITNADGVENSGTFLRAPGTRQIKGFSEVANLRRCSSLKRLKRCRTHLAGRGVA